VREKMFPKKKPPWKGKESGQLEFTTLVSPGTRRNEKGAPISAPFSSLLNG